MNNFDAQCIGQYTKYYIIDRVDFMNKVQEGMSIEEYWNIQQNTRKVYVSIGTVNAKNPFLSYRFEVNGKTYYGTSRVGYSRDIHARMADTPCKVYFQSDNPYISRVGDMNSSAPGEIAQPLNIVAMVMGICSLAFSCIPFFSFIFSAIALAFSIVALNKKKANNYFALAGIICSGIALLIAILVIILFIITVALKASGNL